MPANSNHFEVVLNNNECKGKRKFPYEINEVDPETRAQLLKDFTGEKTTFLQVGPQKWFFPSNFAKDADHYYNFEVRPDDVWVVTFPRSGTTWTQEMVWLLANDLDYDTAAKVPLTARFPFLEFSTFFHPETKAAFKKENSFCQKHMDLLEKVTKPGWEVLEEQTSRRFIKTHLPFSLLPPDLISSGCKIIYVARNPKDVAVSYYHLNRLFKTQGYYGDFPKFWDYFEKNLVYWAPYWRHVQEGWTVRNSENVLFMFYEQMNKANMRDCIGQVANFLDVTLNEDQLNTLENHLKIENFRNNKSVNFDALMQLGVLNNGEAGFVRNGQSGGWKTDYTPDLDKRADKWIEEQLKNVDVRFPL